MADAGKSQPEGMDKEKMKQYLVPALAVAAVVILAALVVYVSGSSVRKMSDGSDGTATDSALKEAAPGVKYRDVKEGTGDPCPAGATVTMHYTGWKPDGEIFDSSKNRGVPFEAILKPGTPKSVIDGWNLGVPGMKKGGIRKLVIAPEKAYGQKNHPLAGATLIFEVELLDFTAPRDLTTGPGQPMPFDKSNGGTDDPGLKDIGGGLKVRDLKEGSGDPVKEGADVTMHYTGWTVDGNVFDSSKKSGQPLDASLTPGTRKSVIAGWNKGIVGMKPGGVRKLVIPAAMGYGERGNPPDIPGGATLIFEVELVK